MALNAQLQALLVPFGTEFPPTVQALLELIAQYEEITGLESFDGINIGPVEPDEDNRDKPWFKTDDDGNLLGWFGWTGSAWTPIPTVIPPGSTANRPVNAVEGQEYFDSDIHVALVFERSQWRTLSGSPGDVKEVKAATLEDALTKNPGWEQDTDSIGRVIVGVSDGSAFGYGDTGGEIEHTLTTEEIPSHAHTTPSGGDRLQADGNASRPAGILSGVTPNVTGPVGGGLPHNNMPPFVAYWRLVKT